MDIRELRQKADSGSCVAPCVLGLCYLDGTDVEADYQEAFRLLTAAANQGASRAVLSLARMHSDGLGNPRKVPEAIRIYETVANVEFLAAAALGRIYSRGLGAPIDSDEALKWYSIAGQWESRVHEGEEIREAKAYLQRRTEN